MPSRSIDFFVVAVGGSGSGAWRTTTGAIKSKGLMTLMGILVSGLVAAAWVGIKDFVGK